MLGPLEELATRLLIVLEGSKLKAYQESGGKWTIGVGHTRTAKEGMVITPQQCQELLAGDMSYLIEMVTTDHQCGLFEQAALLSFGFNCGTVALSRVLRNDIQVTPDGFMAPDGKGGRVPYGIYDLKKNKLDGLIARRRLEAGMVLASRAGGQKVQS